MSTSSSFWQSDLWKSILIDSYQAKDVHIFHYGSVAILIEFRSIGLGMLGAFSLGVDIKLYDRVFIEKCQDYASSCGALFWQTEEYTLPTQETLGVTPTYHDYGRNFLEPWTRILDLSLTEEELLGAMHEKCRYNIKLAWKRGVKATWVEPTKDHIDMWMELLSETTTRDRFSKNSREYYVHFLQMLRSTNAGGLIFAGYNGRIIAAGIFVYYRNTALYYYGASTSDVELRKHMAPYMLQWEAIREAKLRGCQHYDFLGIAPPGTGESHPLQGVSQFKEKFGGTAVNIGSKNLFVLKLFRYYLIFTPIRIMKKGLQMLFRRR